MVYRLKKSNKTFSEKESQRAEVHAIHLFSLSGFSAIDVHLHFHRIRTDSKYSGINEGGHGKLPLFNFRSL